MKKNKSIVRAVIFDMDGVIIDSEPLSDQHMHGHLKKMGIEVSIDYFDQFRGVTSKKLWTDLSKEFGLTQPLEELILYSRTSYIEFLEQQPELEPMPGVKDLLTDLKKNNFKLAVASSAYIKRIEKILNLFAIKDFFDAVVSGDQVEHGKPAPDVYLKAAKDIGVSPEYCVVIEDATNGITAGKSAGMKVIGFAGMIHNKQDMSAADAVVKDFKDISLPFLYNLYQ